MTGFLFYLLAGTLSILIPLLSLLFWSLIFSIIFPGSKDLVRRIMRFDTAESWKKEASITLSQLLFYISALISIPGSVFLEALFFIPFIWIGIFDNGIVATFLVSLAGPIEESMKLLAALALHLIIMRSFRFDENRPDKVRIGIIAGLFTGAVFGIIESVGYLSVSLSTMISGGLSIQTMDEFVFRAVFGVSAHAIFTGLASGGLGRNGRQNKIRVTAILLSIAVLLHSLNNFSEGMVVLVLEMEGALGIFITNVIQISLLASGLFLLILVWRGRFPGPDRKNVSNNSFSGIQRSKSLYPSHRDR